MPITRYDGRTAAVNIAGNVSVVIVPAIADMKAPTVAEIEAGQAIECAIRDAASPKGDVQTKSEQMLCDVDAVETPGSTKWSIDPITIQRGDPQKPNPLLDGLEKGDIVYVVERDGLPHETAYAAAQLVSVTRARINAVTHVVPKANTDGDKFEAELNLAVESYERVAVVAA